MFVLESCQNVSGGEAIVLMPGLGSIPVSRHRLRRALTPSQMLEAAGQQQQQPPPEASDTQQAREYELKSKLVTSEAEFENASALIEQLRSDVTDLKSSNAATSNRVTYLTSQLAGAKQVKGGFSGQGAHTPAVAWPMPQRLESGVDATPQRRVPVGTASTRACARAAVVARRIWSYGAALISRSAFFFWLINGVRRASSTLSCRGALCIR